MFCVCKLGCREKVGKRKKKKGGRKKRCRKKVFFFSTRFSLSLSFSFPFPASSLSLPPPPYPQPHSLLLKVLGERQLVLPRPAALQARHHAVLLVLPDPLLEKVGLALQRQHLHPVEGVGRLVVLVRAQGDENTDVYKNDVHVKKKKKN